jgi:hypothetical protein
METFMNRIHRISAIALALAVAPAAWSAGAMGHKSMSQAQQQYQQDREYCRSGQATEPRALCLKEAAAAYAEASGHGKRSTKAMGAGPAHDSQKAAQKAKVKTEAKPQDK